MFPSESTKRTDKSENGDERNKVNGCLDMSSETKIFSTLPSVSKLCIHIKEMFLDPQC